MQFLKELINTSHPIIRCPQEWSKLISALAYQSPVCALVHPNDQLFNLLKKIGEDNFTSDPLSMEILQREVPILFEVLGTVSHLLK